MDDLLPKPCPPEALYDARIRTEDVPCAVCNGKGHRVQTRFPALYIEADQMVRFGRVVDVRGCPNGAERALVRSGASVMEAIAEGIRLAGILGRGVAFEFNQTTLSMHAGSKPDDVLGQYWNLRGV